MGETLLIALGALCVAHCTSTFWVLGRRAARAPRAWDACTGRPLRVRLDRRRGARRAGDRR